ncbi:MAG: SRPBCC family protein, partial [Mycobacterium sp.]
MALVSKTLEVEADASTILAIVADFETYPEWNEEVKAVYILARYNDGRPSQLRIDTEIQGQPGTFIQAVFYHGPELIQTVMQQGVMFSNQEQFFSVVGMGTVRMLTVD